MTTDDAREAAQQRCPGLAALEGPTMLRFLFALAYASACEAIAVHLRRLRIAEQMARGTSVRERAARDARCNAPGGVS